MSDDFQKMLKTMMEQGQDMAQELSRAFNPSLEAFKMPGADMAGMGKAMPTMSADMMEMWFGKTFNRDGLDAKTRLLVTLGALTAQGAVAEPQIRLTVRHAVEAGATQKEIAEVIYQMSMFGGLPAMTKALEIAQSVFSEMEGKA